MLPLSTLNNSVTRSCVIASVDLQRWSMFITKDYDITIMLIRQRIFHDTTNIQQVGT